MVETLDCVEGTINGQGYARIFSPETFEPQDVVHGALGLGHEQVRRQGREIVDKGFAILHPPLGHHAYAVADTPTIADIALFYVEHWAAGAGITPPVNVAAHHRRMLARPAVHRVLQW